MKMKKIRLSKPANENVLCTLRIVSYLCFLCVVLPLAIKYFCAHNLPALQDLWKQAQKRGAAFLSDGVTRAKGE